MTGLGGGLPPGDAAILRRLGPLLDHFSEHG